MNNPPQKLLVRTDLFPGESLSSFLARLTKLNAYDQPPGEPPGLLRRVCLEGTTYWEDFDNPYVSETYARLEVLTQIDADRLYEATPHRLVALTPVASADKRLCSRTLELPNGRTVQAMSPAVVKLQLRPNSAAQFCPICLQQGLYHRLAWLPLAVSACTEHLCLLESLCYKCRQSVDISDVVDACCSRCHHDLRNTPVNSIEEDVFGSFSQKIIQWWVGVSKVPALPWRFVLPNQSQVVMYHFVDSLSKTLLTMDPGWPYWHRFPRYPSHSVGQHRMQLGIRTVSETASNQLHPPKPGDLYCVYATAFKAVIDWPVGFNELLHVYTLRDEYETRMLEDLGPIYTELFERVWQNDSFSFVREAFEDYQLRTYTAPVLALNQGFRQLTFSLNWEVMISSDDAARLLALPEWVVRHMIANQAFNTYENPGTTQIFSEKVGLREVLELRHKWRSGVPLDQVTRWLGEKSTRINQLVQSGRLEIDKSHDGNGKTPDLCRLLT